MNRLEPALEDRVPETKDSAPMYASPWVAFFCQIRESFTDEAEEEREAA